MNNLEKRFDELTPDWIVSSSRMITELGDWERNPRWSLCVQFKSKTVRRASFSNGELKRFETTRAIPDFVVMSKSGHERYTAMIERAKSGQDSLDPFRDLGCKSGFYIEVFGDYWHSGKYVHELSRDEHESEVVDAYRSAGCDVLILWENEVNERWDEICIPKIRKFISKASDSIDVPEWKIGRVTFPDDLAIDSWKSLRDASYWKGLDDDKRMMVVDFLLEQYSEIEYPWPDVHMAKSDFVKFCDWSGGSTNKSTRFGLNCCRYFIRSMVHSRVKGNRSLYEIWSDKDLLKKSIIHQLENFTGSHHSRRFLNAMCHVSGFRLVSNLHPARVVKWIGEYSKKGGVFFDPCAGWGGRMLAAHVLGMKYVAIDANKVLVDELNEMADVLGIDAKVLHGSCEDIDLVKIAMGDNKADLVFTSPPYFDSEIYSEDPEQSIQKFSDKRTWYERFCGGMVRNITDVLSDDGIAVLNVPGNFKLNWIGSVLEDVDVEDVDVLIDTAKSKKKERLLKFRKSRVSNRPIGSHDFVSCEICHRRFGKLGWHLKKTHGMSVVDYQEKFPGSSIVSLNYKQRIARENSLKTKRRTKRVAYRCPDGSVVWKRDAWKRAWESDSPPEDSILKPSEVVCNDENGVDFVVCSLCGHRGKNISRHLRDKHSIEPSDYDGQVRSVNCQKALSSGAMKSWDSRGRKPACVKVIKKKDKLTQEILFKLYVKDGLSDSKIGKMYEMTGEGVSYRRKKFGISTLKRGGS